MLQCPGHEQPCPQGKEALSRHGSQQAALTHPQTAAPPCTCSSPRKSQQVMPLLLLPLLLLFFSSHQ
jgi:hypothetical protein